MMVPKEERFDKLKSIAELTRELDQFVRNSAADGQPLHDVEQRVLGAVLELGRCYVDQFIKLQGDGDLGLTLTTEEGKELHRSEETVDRTFRTVLGVHTFSAYVYAPGPKKKIALRPIDARRGLPEGSVCASRK